MAQALEDRRSAAAASTPRRAWAIVGHSRGVLARLAPYFCTWGSSRSRRQTAIREAVMFRKRKPCRRFAVTTVRDASRLLWLFVIVRQPARAATRFAAPVIDPALAFAEPALMESRILSAHNEPPYLKIRQGSADRDHNTPARAWRESQEDGFRVMEIRWENSRTPELLPAAGRANHPRHPNHRLEFAPWKGSLPALS